MLEPIGVIVFARSTGTVCASASTGQRPTTTAACAGSGLLAARRDVAAEALRHVRPRPPDDLAARTPRNWPSRVPPDTVPTARSTCPATDHTPDRDRGREQDGTGIAWLTLAEASA